MEMRPSTSRRLSAPAHQPVSPPSGTPSNIKPGPRSVRNGSQATSSTASTSGGKSGGPPPTNTSSTPTKAFLAVSISLRVLTPAHELVQIHLNISFDGRNSPPIHHSPLADRSHHPTHHWRPVKRSIPRLRPRPLGLKTPLRRRIEQQHIRKASHRKCSPSLQRNNPRRLRTHQRKHP